MGEIGDFANRNGTWGTYKRVGMLPGKGEIGDFGGDFRR